jgi:predicted transcriptional regulator
VKTLRVGIASYEEMKARTLAIASGRMRPSRNEPTVWFTSLESLARILSERNRALLEMIAEQKPASLSELEELSGRAKSNLSRTLRTMQRYGLVELTEGEKRRTVPRVAYEKIRLELPLLARTG